MIAGCVLWNKNSGRRQKCYFPCKKGRGGLGAVDEIKRAVGFSSYYIVCIKKIPVMHIKRLLNQPSLNLLRTEYLS